MPGIRYLSEMSGGVPVVATPAEIDIGTADKLRVVLLEATSNGYPTVVVDMTRTRFCDCAVLTTLLRAHKRVLAEGSGLRLVIPADGVVPRIGAALGEAAASAGRTQTFLGAKRRRLSGTCPRKRPRPPS